MTTNIASKKILSKFVAVVAVIAIVLCVAPVSGLSDILVNASAEAPVYDASLGSYTTTIDSNGNTVLTAIPNDGCGFSITALVLGCCGIVFCWAAGLNFVLLACDILGIIFGVKGRKKSTLAYGKPSGLATAGFVLGIIGTAICALGVLSCVACASCDACYGCAMASAFESML